MCGASFAIPQIAGLFLLSRQIDKEIRFNEFIDIIKNPQTVNKEGMNYINTNEIIKQVEKNRKEKIEKRIFFHDQKSDAFFRDESSGVYTVPTQEQIRKEDDNPQFFTNEQYSTSEQEYLISFNIEESIKNNATVQLGEDVVSASSTLKKDVKELLNKDKVVENTEERDNYDGK